MIRTRVAWPSSVSKKALPEVFQDSCQSKILTKDLENWSRISTRKLRNGKSNVCALRRPYVERLRLGKTNSCDAKRCYIDGIDEPESS